VDGSRRRPGADASRDALLKILDRYIIRQFLINWIILYVVLMSLFVVVDLLVDLDEFLEAGRVRAQTYGGVWLGTLATLVDYYGPVLMLLYVFFSGLIVVAATGFTVAGFVRHRELIGMISGGVSMYRSAAPLIAVGFLLNLLVVPNQELIIPQFAHKLARSKSEVSLEAIRSFSIRLAPDSRGNLFSAREFDASERMLRDVTILDRSEDSRSIRRISAAQAFWIPDGQRSSRGTPGPGWELVGGDAISRDLGADGFGSVRDRAVQPIFFLPSDLSPTLLVARRARHFPRFLSILELRELLANEGVRQDSQQVRRLTQIVQSRVSMFIFATLLQVIALPLFLRREPNVHLLLQGVKAATVVLGAWAVGMLMSETGVPWLNPVTAAWLPVVLALPIAAFMLSEVKT